MPVTIKTNIMKYKSSQGEYKEINAVSDHTAAEQIALIQSAGTTQVGNVNSAGSTQITNINNRATEIENSWPSDYSDLTDDVDDLQSAINVLEGTVPNKVNKPQTNPDGANGQLLRSLGNGQTEWTNAGAPTDEQVGTAVDTWLADHPEATTTVEDFSLTANKLVKGTLGYVIPQQFGASGDGVTDDTQALKDCIDYAMANGFAVRLPMGTYIVTHGPLLFRVGDGQSIVIIGEGQNSIIKRKDNSLPPPPEEDQPSKWCQMITIEVKPTNTHANDVILANFCMDGNRRNQDELINMEDADTTYGYEPSACISIRNGTGLTSDEQYLDRFIVSYMRFYDPVADCVNVSGNSQVRIRNVFIDNMVATDRHGTRNDIGVTANPMNAVFITNCDCYSIHFENNRTTQVEDSIIPYNITGCKFKYLSLAAKVGPAFDIYINDCIIDERFLIGNYRNAVVTNCKIPSKGSSYKASSENGECTFRGCRIETIINPDNEYGYVYPFHLWKGTKISIIDCDFGYSGELTQDYDSDGVNDHVVGYAIDISGNEQVPVLIDGCRFDKCFTSAIKYDSNNITLRNLTIGTYYIIEANAGNITEYGYLTFDNVRATEDCKYCIRGGTIKNTFILNGDLHVDYNNFKMNGSSTDLKTWMTKTEGDFRRVVHITSPLDLTEMRNVAGIATYNLHFFLFNGDTFVYEGADRQKYPEKWIVKNTEYTSYSGSYALTNGTELKERLITYGSGYGATVDRPICYMSPGFEFFDTTLGKKIVWNGTTWVNCDGTAL